MSINLHGLYLCTCSYLTVTVHQNQRLLRRSRRRQDLPAFDIHSSESRCPSSHTPRRLPQWSSREELSIEMKEWIPAHMRETGALEFTLTLLHEMQDELMNWAVWRRNLGRRIRFLSWFYWGCGYRDGKHRVHHHRITHFNSFRRETTLTNK